MKFSITLGGSARELKFTLRGIKALEDEVGFSVFSEAFFKTQTSWRLAQMVWAGLLHQNPKLTLDEVAEMIDQDPGAFIRDASGVVWEAYNHYWAPKSENAEEEKKTETESPSR